MSPKRGTCQEVSGADGQRTPHLRTSRGPKQHCGDPVRPGCPILHQGGPLYQHHIFLSQGRVFADSQADSDLTSSVVAGGLH